MVSNLKKGLETDNIKKTKIDADYADDKSLLSNTPAQTEYLLQGIKQKVGVVGIHVNANKAEYTSLYENELAPL